MAVWWTDILIKCSMQFNTEKIRDAAILVCAKVSGRGLLYYHTSGNLQARV